MNSSFAVILLLALLWPFSSGKTIQMTANNSVPAASGTIHVQQNKKNGNTNLDIKVNNLAAPSSLTPSEEVYIVWVRPNGQAAIKKGAIGVGSNLQGELKAATVSRNFEVLITAEQSAHVTAPSDVEVLKAHVSLS